MTIITSKTIENIRVVLPVEKSVTRVHDRDGYGNVVVCPVCGTDYTHAKRMRTDPGNDRAGTAWMGRGGAFFVGFTCENGHEWELRFGFHKGQTFGATEVSKCTENERDDLTSPAGEKMVKRLVEKKALFDF